MINLNGCYYSGNVCWYDLFLVWKGYYCKMFVCENVGFNIKFNWEC